ncbi:MAG: pseudouridine synthase [Alistipes sp.]|nr:pseudouridine synthase [Alistipes sp.]
MKNYNTDSTANVSRFARDKRQRISSTERVERNPRPQREADDAGYRQGFGHKPAAKRASFNPNFTDDNRPLSQGKPYRSGRPQQDRGEGRFSTAQRGEHSRGGEGRPSYGRYNDDRRTSDRRFSERPAYKKNFSERNRTADGEVDGNRIDHAPAQRQSYRSGSSTRNGERRNDSQRPYSGAKHAGRDTGKRQLSRKEEDRPRTYPKYNPNTQTGEIRLNRFISQSGICSRREADDFITAGVVSVNGVVVTELGTKIKPTDEVRFNDERIEGEKNVYLVLNKPKGYVTSLEDPHADKTVMELVKGACTERIYPVGRLDKNSLGLLLFTNDGDLTKQLTHPSYRKKKIYQVSLDKPLTRADMDTLTQGITLEDGEIYADEVAYVNENKKEVGVEIHSGRNRIVRRMFEHLGYAVQKLDRVYYAGLTKKNLKRGAWRFLTREEVMRLKTGQYE